MTDQTPDPWRDVQQRDETIRQLQDAFARCQEVQQATAETWRIEHDQMVEQIRLLRGAMAADDERLRRAAEQAGILYVSCDTAEALAEQIARLSAQVEQLRDWQATVTAALQRPSGAFYEDVPRHIRDLRAAISTVDAQIHQQAELLAQRWDALSIAEATIAALRAERDAERQQIATLTEVLDVAAQDIRDWVKTARGLRDRVVDPDHDPSTPHLRGIVESEQVLSRIYAALQSTRPQEQP